MKSVNDGDGQAVVVAGLKTSEHATEEPSASDTLATAAGSADAASMTTGDESKQAVRQPVVVNGMQKSRYAREVTRVSVANASMSEANASNAIVADNSIGARNQPTASSGLGSSRYSRQSVAGTSTQGAHSSPMDALRPLVNDATQTQQSDDLHRSVPGTQVPGPTSQHLEGNIISQSVGGNSMSTSRWASAADVPTPPNNVVLPHSGGTGLASSRHGRQGGNRGSRNNSSWSKHGPKHTPNSDRNGDGPSA